MLKSICKYIQENDRNSDIMDCYQELTDGVMDENTLVEICQRVLGDWKEDLELNGMTPKEKTFMEWLGI